MTDVFLNRIATATPGHDIHQKFVDYAALHIKEDRKRAVFLRMAERSQIEHRYSFLPPHEEDGLMDRDGFYLPKAFPDTGTRMHRYKQDAFKLVRLALDRLEFDATEVTHLVVTTCTGFYAPGIDIDIINHYGMKPDVERSIIGFMGCYAAINGMKAAWNIVRSVPCAKVLVVNLELCTLHLQETEDLETLLSFLIFADGCSASLISKEPVGLELQSFYSTILPESSDQITWHIGNQGFDMVLSGKVPLTVFSGISGCLNRILGGIAISDIQYWAIHPGGRSILDAIRDAIALPEKALEFSRDVLRHYGNMSSATIMFVLKEIMEDSSGSGPGCAMAFGPGVMAETMLFRKGSADGR